MTCKDVGDKRLFHCSNCGYYISDIFDDNSILDEEYRKKDKFDSDLFAEMCSINFCPHCGAEIIEEVSTDE